MSSFACRSVVVWSCVIRGVYPSIEREVNRRAGLTLRLQYRYADGIMTFDASIAAQQALQRVQVSGELGEHLDDVLEAESVFSASVGDDALAAYESLQALSVPYAHAKSFQAFLIYITWQQFVEETSATHVHIGLSLCDRYLAQWNDGSPEARQIIELRTSYKAALGESEEEEDECDEDVFKGGD